MGKSNLMDRVANDLAKGHTHPAKQRLHSLIAAHPTDLDLRRQVADLYRMVGDLVEAGRWSYLDEAADPVETLAFERAYPSLTQRRLALRWPTHALAPTDWVRKRLAELPAPPSKLRVSIRLNWTKVIAGAILGGLALIGIYSIVEWLFR